MKFARACAVLSAAGLVSALILPAAANAAAPPWVQVSAGGVQAFDQTGLLRTNDGKLHVAWAVENGNSDWSLASAVLSSTGKVLSKGWVVQHWFNVQLTPRLIPYGSGIAVVFNGAQTSNPNSAYSDNARFLATSPDGRTWSLAAGSLSSTGNENIDIAATTLADGTPVTAQGVNNQLFWHVGLDAASPAATPDGVLTGPAGSAFENPSLARARDGSVWLSYYQEFVSAGYYVRQLLPTLGSPVPAPGGARGNQDNAPYQAVAMATGAAGAVFLAYCEVSASARCARIALWRVGTAKPMIVPGSAQAASVALSSGPGGRLTISWYDHTKSAVDVVWTNHAVRKFSARRVVPTPAKVLTFNGLGLDAARGPADLFANVYRNVTSQPVQIWHTQTLPSLAVSVSTKTFSHAKAVKLTFKVSDVGDPVPGCKVSFDGKSALTNRKGIAVIKLAKGVKKGTRTAVARRSGWLAGSVKIATV